jgi:Predicted protease with the C-terminal PDZ domain
MPCFCRAATGLAILGLASADLTHAQATPPRDEPWPGPPITLHVDLRDSAQKIFHVTESIPVQPGPLTLDYPKWIPGEHGPTGPIVNVAGLKIHAGGKRVPFRRDLEDMYRLHVDVPKGADRLDLSFDFLSPTGGGAFGDSVSATPQLVDLEWNQVLFYPDGHYSSQIQFRPSVCLPADWQHGTALQMDGRDGDTLRFAPLSLEMLIDSPLIAGRHFRRFDLAPGADVPVYLDVVADTAHDLELPDEELEHFRALIVQAQRLFRARHYRHYTFLLTLSDETGHFGLEHHESSDDRLWANYFTDANARMAGAGLLPHEFVHSWNGKFRRPADLWTANFNLPMRDDLLWVYEGLTTYWGQVLTARSGLLTPQQYRDELALTAAAMAHRVGRQWRSLQDTTDAAPMLYTAPGAWASWRRSADFYPEGELLWLEIDVRIRRLSDGRRSLDDFAKRFFGMDDGVVGVRTYGFDDLVAALNAVQADDWKRFLRTRLDRTGGQGPLAGITDGGYRLVYRKQESAFGKAVDAVRKRIDLMTSIGLSVATDSGRISDVQWDGPAFAAGLHPGQTLVAVDGRKFSAEGLKRAVTRAAEDRRPIELLISDGPEYRTLKVDYHGGLRYPHLEPAKDQTPLLDRIIAPRKR